MKDLKQIQKERQDALRKSIIADQEPTELDIDFLILDASDLIQSPDPILRLKEIAKLNPNLEIELLIIADLFQKQSDLFQEQSNSLIILQNLFQNAQNELNKIARN